MKNIPALDGLRGLAVAGVVAYHSGTVLHGGHLGVDVFFVLSGFLITRLLLGEQAATGRVSYRNFYARRALRLGPALAACLLLVGALVAVDPLMRARIGTSVGAAFASTVLYANNWLDVFDTRGTGPLGHTWSLSVEEQFYLLWPPVLLWGLRRRSRERVATRVLWAVVCFAALRALLSVVSHGFAWEYATTSKADAPLIGCALALLLHQARSRSRSLPEWSGWLALGSLVIAFLFVPSHSQGLMLGGFTLVSVCAAVLLANLVLDPASRLSGLLALRPLTFLGRVSYGLYLYHWPIFLEVRGRVHHRLPQIALEWTLAAVVTLVSYYAIERPALTFKNRFEPIQEGRPRLPA